MTDDDNKKSGKKVYLYCTPEDKALAKHFAKELKIPVKKFIHKLLWAAEIAIPNKSKVLVVNWAEYLDIPEVPK